jgi:D-glycero-D-manno-heptose 1,7-bisphosphate phosphatase
VRDNRIGVFIDRDGTLIEEMDYVRTPDDVHLIHGAAHAIRKLNENGFITNVISNQSGVARGFLTEADLAPIHDRLERDLQQNEAHIDHIYYCPHHPAFGIEPYNVECECRKPRPGMLIQSRKEFGIDLARSFVIGDKVADMQAGAAVGATTILVLTGYGKSSLETCKRENINIDFVAPSIKEAVEFVLEKGEGELRSND